jgi:signal transduction histidine kinase
MKNRVYSTSIWTGPHLWRMVILMVACAFFYYLYAVARVLGLTSLEDTLLNHHEFYGLVFFVPVVYASYIYGVRGAVLTALVSMLALFPYSLSEVTYPDAVIGPSSFAVILSAVGCVIAMLQKGEAQRLRGRDEMKCLYDVGKAGELSNSIDEFVYPVLDLIPNAINSRDTVGVRIVIRDKIFESSGFKETSNKIEENLTDNARIFGAIIIYSKNTYTLRNRYHFIKTLAERVSGAVQRIELDQALKLYSEHLENMVKERTKDLEQAQDKIIRSEKLAAVGELASGVGHELRNPLNVIRNCVYLLNMTLVDKFEKVDEEIQNTLKLLDQQVDISNKIVSDLLDFTRVRKPCFGKVDLNEIVKHSLSLVEVPGGINIVSDLYEYSPQIMVDSEQIERAFLNVVTNGLQAMNGKGSMTIKTGLEDGHAWAKFIDSGCGIAEENIEKIFEPLFTTKRNGIGLGLAITKRLIDQNYGTVEVTSQVAKGTTFTVRLPLYKKEMNRNERASAYSCS